MWTVCCTASVWCLEDSGFAYTDAHANTHTYKTLFVLAVKCVYTMFLAPNYPLASTSKNNNLVSGQGYVLLNREAARASLTTRKEYMCYLQTRNTLLDVENQILKAEDPNTQPWSVTDTLVVTLTALHFTFL